MEEGNMLGNILSKYGLRIDREKVTEIQTIGLPMRKK